jgi:hypothetical protein
VPQAGPAGAQEHHQRDAGQSGEPGQQVLGLALVVRPGSFQIVQDEQGGRCGQLGRDRRP